MQGADSDALFPMLKCRKMAAINMSPSTPFRSVECEDGLPTILFDEIDTVFGPKAKKENEEIRGLLNAGHRRGKKTYRTVMFGQKATVEGIEAFSAVAMAGIGWLPDTLLGRSIIIRMRRRHDGESIEPFRYRVHAPQGHQIYIMVQVWAEAQPQEISTWPEMPEAVQDRAADAWESLLAVADAIGGKWPVLARNAAVALLSEAGENEPSLGSRLLIDLKIVFKNATALSSKQILQDLQALDESPWRDLKGKPLDERGLAHRLRREPLRREQQLHN